MLYEVITASIARWDEVLVASAGEPWAEQQRGKTAGVDPNVFVAVPVHVDLV